VRAGKSKRQKDAEDNRSQDGDDTGNACCLNLNGSRKLF